MNRQKYDRHWLLCLASLLSCSRVCMAAKPLTIMIGGVDKLIYLPAKLVELLGYFCAEGLAVRLYSEGSDFAAGLRLSR